MRRGRSLEPVLFFPFILYVNMALGPMLSCRRIGRDCKLARWAYTTFWP